MPYDSPEKRAANNRKYREEHRPEFLAYQAKWREKQRAMRNYRQDAAQYNPNKYDQTPTPDNGLNMHIPVSGDEYKSTPEQIAAARQTVAHNAIDAQDATELMKMLGLI